MISRLIIAFVILVVWAANYTVAIFNSMYHPPIEVNAPMLLVAGYFFGSGVKRVLKNGQSNDSN